MNTALAFALIVVGIVLLCFGLSSADSIRDSFSRFFTGHFSDRTAWLVVGGSVCILAGLAGGGYRMRRA